MDRGNFNISRFKSHLSSVGGLSRGLFFVCDIAVSGPVIENSLSTGSRPSSGQSRTRRNYTNGAQVLFQENQLLVCKSVNIPTETLDTIDIKYFTRGIKIPGSRQFQPITLTFYNTVRYDVLDTFKVWLNRFNDWQHNERYDNNNYESLFGTMNLYHFRNDGRMKAQDLLKVVASAGVSAATTVASRINPVVGSIGNMIAAKYGDKFAIESNNPRIATYKFNKLYPTTISGLQFSYDDDAAYQTFDVEFQYLDMEFEKGKDN